MEENKNDIAQAFNAAVEAFKTKVMPTVKDGWKEVTDTVKGGFNDLGDQFKDLISVFTGPGAEVVNHEFEVLNKQRLVEVAKSIQVEGADGTAAYKVAEDDSIFVYLANVKDRDLLPKENNKYAIIKASALNGEVLSLFGKEECIILT